MFSTFPLPVNEDTSANAYKKRRVNTATPFHTTDQAATLLPSQITPGDGRRVDAVQDAVDPAAPTNIPALIPSMAVAAVGPSSTLPAPVSDPIPPSLDKSIRVLASLRIFTFIKVFRPLAIVASHVSTSDPRDIFYPIGDMDDSELDKVKPLEPYTDYIKAALAAEMAYGNLLYVVKHSPSAYRVLSTIAVAHPSRVAAEANIDAILAHHFRELEACATTLFGIPTPPQNSIKNQQFLSLFVEEFTTKFNTLITARRAKLTAITQQLQTANVGGLPIVLYPIIGEYAGDDSEVTALMHMQTIPDGMVAMINPPLLGRKTKGRPLEEEDFSY